MGRISMGTIRRRLRVVAAAWLLFQAMSLSAAVSRDCCAGHRAPEAVPEASCHDTAPAHETSVPADDDCSMGPTCGGPYAALISTLSNPALTVGTFTLHVGHTALVAVPGQESPVPARPGSPESPPPRA